MGYDKNSPAYLVYHPDNGKVILIWVDDLIEASDDMDLVNQFKDGMKREFKLKDLGRISLFIVTMIK